MTPLTCPATSLILQASPVIDQLISWSASLDKSLRPDFNDWLSQGSPTPGYTQQKPTYFLDPRYDLVDDYGSRATVINAALEIAFGSRGSTGWTIWASGDRINMLMQDVRQAILVTKADSSDTQIGLLDLWIDDLFEQLKTM